MAFFFFSCSLSAFIFFIIFQSRGKRPVLSQGHRDTVTSIADKLGFVQTFLFLHRFMFFFSSLFVLLLYASANALNKSAML